MLSTSKNSIFCSTKEVTGVLYLQFIYLKDNHFSNLFLTNRSWLINLFDINFEDKVAQFAIDSSIILAKLLSISVPKLFLQANIAAIVVVPVHRNGSKIVSQ